ncbi:helix-turn-helix transcriptional regulator [Lacrimispora sp.]|uniref:helix-turn-helix transcriptional regulator n=1 Tax=Lacrimispora sp. TaxID=2719234 RepID=UPI00289827AE|nr:helix-turn-helix transcriptional regulator [Lacrimispora sp.]
MEKIYTTQEVADQLKIKKSTVYELIKRGELRANKVGKQIRISQEQLDEYLKVPNNSSSFQADEPLPGIMDIPLFTADSAIRQMDYLLNASGLIISSQESRVVELLRSQLSLRPDSLPILHSYMNEYNSLYSLYYEKTHMALTSFCTGREGQEIQQIQSLLPGKEAAIIHICSLQTGFYIRKGNPKDIHTLKDLCRPDIRFMNREKGNGYRIYLDSGLSAQSIEKTAIPGYQKECLSHMSAANAVASGAADAGIGDISHLAAYPQLDYIPLSSASMDLVFPIEVLNHPSFQRIADTISSKEFKNSLLPFKGYEISKTGNCTFVNR